jgi:hypothetical protein
MVYCAALGGGAANNIAEAAQRKFDRTQSLRYQALLLALLCAGPIGQAVAQAPPEGRGAAAEGKTIGIARATSAPVVDGRLDDALWATATVIADLHQMNPVEYSTPTERTEIRIAYDDDALYVGAKLWYRDPATITARVLRQGEGLSNEDRLAVILDPYLDRRSGYRFEVNAHGVRWDALYQNTTSVESNWEGIWLAASQRDADGWTTEIAIP